MNKTTWIIGGVIAGGMALFGLVLGLWLIGTYNSAASLKNQYEMKVASNEAEFDNMWKKIQQTAQVPEAQKNGFREIFEGYATARTSQGQGQLMTWIKEKIPNVKLDLYKTLMNIIIGSRDGWTRNQNELVSVASEYNNLLVRFPGNVILPILGFQKINPKIISSTRTKDAFATGKDDDVALPLGQKPAVAPVTNEKK